MRWCASLTTENTAYEHGALLGLVHASVQTSRPILMRVGFKSYGEARPYSLAAVAG
jgi:hypothetical protein